MKKNIDLNPFPGLRPFGSGDADFFFGREIETGEVIEKLLKNRYVTVLGDGGCGKSSLIYSGILPKIRNYIAGESSVWKTISFRLGNDPLGNLAESISKALPESEFRNINRDGILSDLIENPDGLNAVVRKYLIKPDHKLILVIDQFEDLFRYGTYGKPETVNSDIIKFVELLLKTVITPAVNILIIVAMRSDYTGECSHYHGLTKFINDSNYLIPGMAADSYREVIEKPLKNTGAKIDLKLVETLLDDVRDRKDQLPALQHAMMRTWNHWKELNESDKPISKTDYESIGTISKALSLHADEVYEGLSQRGKEICQTMFKTLARKGLDNKGLRHPSDIKTIKAIAKCSGEELTDVIHRFRSKSVSFILPPEDVILTDDTFVDIYNESLIDLWERLKVWVDDENTEMIMYLQLSEASALYQQGKTGLLKPNDLQLAIKWRDEHIPSLPWAVQYNPAFERAMVYLRTSEKTYLEEEHTKIRLQKRNVKRTWVSAVIFGVSAIIALILMFHANVQKISAEKRANLSEKQRIQTIKEKAAADSNALIAFKQKTIADSITAVAVNDAREAQEQKIVADIQKSFAERKAEDATHQKNSAVMQSDSARMASIMAEQKTEEAIKQRNAIQRLRMISVGKSISLKSMQMTGQKDLQALMAFQAYLFNKRNNGPDNDADIYAGLYNVAMQYGSINYRSYKGHNGAIRGMAFVPGKNEFFTSGSDGKVLKWSLGSKDQTLQVLYSGKDIMDVLAVSPDVSWLACGSETSSIRMIPLKGNNIGYELAGHKGGIKSLIFSFDGKYLYSAALDGKVLKWDIAARTSTNVATGLTEISSIDISSKGNYLAGISTDGNVVVWDPERNTDNFRIETAGKNIKVIKFNPENNLLAIGDATGKVELWDINLRKKISEVKAHDSQVNSIQFNNSLKQMATSGNDKKLKLFNIKDPSDLSQPPITLNDNDGFILVMQFSPDGQMIVSGESGGTNNLVSRPSHVDYLVRDICTLISRDMTQEEWNAYVGKDIPLEKVCQDKGLNIKVDQIK